MKWISLALGLLGAVVLAVVGRFWQDMLGSTEFKLIFFLSQVSGPAVSSSGNPGAGAALSFLRAVPWSFYAGAVLSLAGMGLVLTKGRIAAIPLLVSAVVVVLPLGVVVVSIPSLAPYLLAALAGGPSALAGFAALAVKGKPRAASPVPEGESSLAPLAAEPVGTAAKSRASDKRLWAFGLAAASVCLLLAIWAGRAVGGKTEEEELFYPAPVALSGWELVGLGEGGLLLGQLVAVEWNGAWYAARVLSSSGGGARVRFVGWGSEWDEDVTSEQMRALPENLVPRAPVGEAAASGAFGSSAPSPGVFTLSFHQPEGGLSESANLREVPPKQTRYTPRLAFSELPLERALAGSALQSDAPFAITATGTMRVELTGARYFAVDSNGKTQLWIDDELVEAGSPIELEAGAHDVRLEHRHDGGARLTLRLRTGSKPSSLRPLDLSREGVAQFAREGDDGWRVVLDESLLFDFDRAELKPSAERALASIYALSLAPVPTAPVTIEGHTDDQGASAYNVELSRRRAETVRAWLTTRGRASSGLGIRAYGEGRPRAPNDTDAHRKLNRRVELVIGSAAAYPPEPVAAPTAPPAATNAAVLDTVNTYYRELNDGTFDANRYFEPAVDRYITMTGTSTSAINHYIRNIFPKQFKEHHFELEAGSLAQQSPSDYSYVERSRYIQAGKQNSVEKRVRVKLHVSPAGKIVSLQQFKVL